MITFIPSFEFVFVSAVISVMVRQYLGQERPVETPNSPWQLRLLKKAWRAFPEIVDYDMPEEME